MKKSRIIVAVISLFLIVVIIVGAVVHFNNKKNFRSSNQESYMATIVMKGYELKIPDKYMAVLDSEMGLMYWNYEQFDMMIDVAELSFDEEISAKLDEYNEMMSEELVVLRPYSELTIDGKSYIYMLYYDAGVPTIHGYAKADNDSVFEIIVLCYEMAVIKPQTDEEIRLKCEELIREADLIIRTAKKTDKEDSSVGEVLIGAMAYENLYEEVEINLSDKYIDHDYVQGIATKASVNFKVRQDYYCTGSKAKNGVNYLKFYSDYNGTLVTVYIQEKDIASYNVKSDIEYGCEKWGNDSSYVAEYIVGDSIFYYYTFYDEYVEENQIVGKYNYVSATDLGDGYVYFIEASSEFEDICNPEFYMDFMNVNLSKPQ